MLTIKLHKKPSTNGAHIVITSQAGAHGGSVCEAKLLEQALHDALPAETEAALLIAMIERRQNERLSEIMESVKLTTNHPMITH